MQWKDKILDFVLLHGPSLIGAVVMLTAGWFVGGWIRRLTERALEKKHFEPPVRMLFGRSVQLLVMGLTAIVALDTVGFRMTTIIAGLSVAGVGVGLAMQGVLGNLVAGLLIIFTKPFRVGEYVDLLSVEGMVDKIDLFTTTLRHADLSRIVIPNRKIIGEVLHNYGTIRQLDLTVGVAYDANLTETIAVVRDILNQHARVLKDPAPVVGIGMLGDSSIDIAVKPWTKVADYGPAHTELYQTIVERFRERNITMPFPQREVRLLNHG
jgi:small conductance mechanosensitive channel